MSFAGAEQEYFLIDRSFFLARPDLLNSGRTLFGAKPPKGQEFDDHYFGAIPERVLAFMLDAERELFKLGIPAKTRHNEVAPGQFEIAPMFERSNVAADHQQLLMVTLKQVAQKHGMECLFHEKPFAGINGSGKHVNFSLGNATEGNLLLPGRHAARQRAVPRVLRRGHPRGPQVRRAAARVGRVGHQRPPPRRQRGAAGDHLDLPRRPAHRRVRPDRQGRRDQLEGEGHADDRRRHAAGPPDRSGRPQPHQPVRLHRQPLRVPRPGLAAVDRRPDGDDQHDPGRGARLHRHRARVARSPTATDFNAAVQKVLEEIITDHGSVVFNGDGYSEDWQVEAAARGLPNLRTTLDALPELITDEAMELFSHYGVFNHREMHSRYEIALEQYALSIGVEAQLDAGDGARPSILPAALRYQTELATNIASLQGGRRRGRHGRRSTR